MGTGSGGAVEYRPALVEVSGPGITTKRLSSAGDSVDISLGDDARSTESLPVGGGLDGLLPALPLALPTVPGLPSLGSAETESAPALGAGTKVRISLGEVRQAGKAHAIAARAAAIKIAISAECGAGSSSGRGHQGYASSSSLVAELAFGELEAAAVAPEAAGSSNNAAISGSGGLPVTGPQAELIAFGGAALLAVGGSALFLTRRRRRSLP
jgi:LPXTG-motif cell wall-anchored protein